jgi:hypothetical protein
MVAKPTPILLFGGNQTTHKGHGVVQPPPDILNHPQTDVFFFFFFNFLKLLFFIFYYFLIEYMMWQKYYKNISTKESFLALFGSLGGHICTLGKSWDYFKNSL